MTEDFYRKFEDKYRGSRDLISGRLAVYLPFVQPLKSLYDDCAAIDLGCGRGEWIELLQSNGFSSSGVDIDEHMLKDCASLGLTVELADAVASLSALSDDSQTIVSAFHLVEHVSFEKLSKIIEEANRVLRPGGILILETPNPENILVGTHEFYLDPSHQKPIPPKLLQFIVKYHGFQRIKMLRLNSRRQVENNQIVTLRTVLEGVGLDYAVIAQKPVHEQNQFHFFDEAFDSDPGLNLESIADCFDMHILSTDSKVKQLATTFSQFQVEFRSEIESARADAEYWRTETEALLRSYSWKVTAPMRYCLNLALTLVKWIKVGMQFLVRIPLKLALDKPIFAARVTSFLARRLPRVHAGFRNLAVSTGLLQDSPISSYGKRGHHLHSGSVGRYPTLPGRDSTRDTLTTDILIDRIYKRIKRNDS